MLLPLLGDVLDRVLPDDKSKEQAKLEVARMALEGRTIELNAIRDVDVAQAQVNAVEASTDVFRGGWRPFIGWVSGVGLAYQFIAYPILHGFYPQLTPLDTDSLMWLITGMLGLGAYRTFEKVKR
jgi:hypothetical protein